ncbi:MAG: calcium/sodium antiporter [Planctomycetota bacterium]
MPESVLLIALGQFLLGGLMLLLGGDWVVRAASSIAIAARLSPLFVGLTIVSLGTSAPEMAVSIAAALDGKGDITIGNVVGSNLFNMLMIVGTAAVFIPLAIKNQITRVDVPVMMAAVGLMAWFARDGAIERNEGFVLVGSCVGYTLVSLLLGRSDPDATDEMSTRGEEELADATPHKKTGSGGSGDSETTAKSGRLWLQFVILVVGIATLILGCEWFVAAAVTFADTLGVPETVIGLTIVSAGTSLPELVTSVAATLKGQRGIAIGNAVGSTTLNVLAVLGLTAVVSPDPIIVAASINALDIPVMVLVSMGLWVMLWTGRRVTRLEGALLIVVYVAYLTYLVIDSGAISATTGWMEGEHASRVFRGPGG